MKSEIRTLFLQVGPWGILRQLSSCRWSLFSDTFLLLFFSFSLCVLVFVKNVLFFFYFWEEVFIEEFTLGAYS